jgi:diguanylate cyclase (GGDEF)-like protein
MASHDMLTGVLNARAYYVACENLILMAKRTGQPYAVLFIDLDHFKLVNDTYGHSAGDAVLKAVASCLGRSIRQSDALGRIGGEEFSIFAPNTDKNGAMQLAEAIRAAVESLNPSIGERNLKVTASIGVATCSGHVEAMQAIQQKADQAMYVAKSLGRNRVSAFDELPQIAVA